MSDISLQKGMKVELVPGAETVYPRALAGMQGIVRGTKDDDFGFPQAFIEWDKNHWRYNGEQDGWTFASHFRPVENEEPEIIGAEIHDVPATPPRQPTEEEEQRIAKYIDAIGRAFERASESDAFFLITLKKDDEGVMNMDMLGSTTDLDLKELPHADLLAFAESEMRRLEDEGEREGS